MRAMTTGAVRCEGQAIRCETIGTMFRMLVFCQIGKAVRDQALSLGKTHMHLKTHKHTHSHTHTHTPGYQRSWTCGVSSVSVESSSPFLLIHY